MTEATRDAHWRRVFELAERGRFSTSPNPRVGAVVVDSAGRVAGEGFHERAGGPHAEAAALSSAGERARGGIVYLNLEPCGHHGRTPPCADALVRAGVARVVYSIEDPDPRTAGAGARRLKQAGIVAEVGAHAEEAERINETFLVAVREQRPFVHLKWGASLDGKTATVSGASRWITGEEGREDAMRLREECDAILVGAGTVLADDPLLTRRLGRNRSILPHRRIVLDGALRVSPQARVFGREGPGEGWLVTARPVKDPAVAPFLARGVRVESLPAPDGTVDLGALLKLLSSLEVRSLLVEGGGTTAFSFLSAGLVDRVTAYLAPLLIGGASAPSPLAGSGFPDLSVAPRLDGLEVTRVGTDVKMTGRLKGRS